MHRILAALLFLASLTGSGQPVGVLRITITLVDAAGTATPVPRHALLISDNPASAPPRRVITSLDGTVETRLRPGNYTVESDQPITFHDKAYQWIQIVDIVSGRDAVLELTAENADVETASAATTAGRPLESDPSLVLFKWQKSVMGLWTPTVHASGFVVNSKGLIATSGHAVERAPSVEVQLSPSLKLAASVLVSDVERDVAIVWVDPQAVASRRALPLECGREATAVTGGQEIFALGVPFRRQRGLTAGTVRDADVNVIASDIALPRGSAGGPVFTAGGDLLGLTSVIEEVDEIDRTRRSDTRIVRTTVLCELLAVAEKKMEAAPPPSRGPLPIEPGRPFPMDALKAAASRRAGSLSPYQFSSSDFDVSFITPVMTYGARYQQSDTRRPGTRPPEPMLIQPVMEFANWTEYVEDFPPVLLVRVTPRLVEGFWTKLARGAARTQGLALPPIKRFKAGFSRLRAFCGEAEVAPIHPFKIVRRVAENEAIYEGLYVFAPDALTPACGELKLMLYSEKAPDQADTHSVDPGIVQQIWQDFEPYRALAR